MKNKAEVLEIVNKARNMKRNMPYSLHSKLMRYDVFRLDTIDSILNTLSKEICLSVHVRDVIQRTYPEAQLCNQCQVGQCTCFPLKNDLPFIVIDCRTENEQQTGTLPNSDLLSKDAYTDPEYLSNIPNHYFQFKGEFHICLMGSGVFKTKDEQSKLESETDDEEDYVQNMLENLLQIFLDNGFPYVSVVEGGYQKIHEFVMHYQLQIEKHDTSMCLVCNPDGPKYNSLIKNSLKRIGTKLVGRVRAFSSAVKNIVRTETVQFVTTEEVKLEPRKAISRKGSSEGLNFFPNS